MQSPERCILCVEDQETCEVLDFLLSYSDYDYVLKTAITAAEGLLLAQREHFDLCLLDVIAQLFGQAKSASTGM